MLLFQQHLQIKRKKKIIKRIEIIVYNETEIIEFMYNDKKLTPTTVFI